MHANGSGGGDSRYIVPALSRGLALLEAFSAERPTLTLSELSKAVGLSRSSTYRLVYTLEDMGFLLRDKGNKAYRLGARILGLGFGYLASQELIELARPHLEALRDRTNCSAHLGVVEGTELIYVVRVPDRKALTSHIRVGSRLAAHATSMGRAILSHLPESEVRNRYAGARLEAYTAHTATDLDSLLALLAADRARGYIISRSASEEGIASVAAPVRDADGAVIAAINISTPEATLKGDELETTLKDAVLETAETISHWLGYRRARAPVAVEARETV
jgi:PcaR/PcaU/PobR family beta-ketoadipate pathway transcriptional regulator